MSLNVKLLRESFALVAPQAEIIADRFYATLFEDYPQVKPLFKNSNMVGQKKALIKSLIFVIENLEKPEDLAAGLYQLGERHVNYEVQESQFPAVGRTLIKVLAEVAGDAWNADLEKAWSDAYAAIQSLTLKGFKEAKEKKETQTA